jgi:Flp pilus assembly protein TadG
MARIPFWRRIDRRMTGRRSDRGIAAVEAAIVTPIFMLVVIGIIEFGLVFKDQLAITSAVRAGARIASAEPRIATFATDAAAQVAREGSALDMSDVQALWVYQADASGHPVGAGGTFNSCATNCDVFSWDGSQFVQTGGAWNATSQNACQGTQDSVGVYLLFRHPGVTQAFFDHLGLSSYTVMRFEPIPVMQAGGCK